MPNVIESLIIMIIMIIVITKEEDSSTNTACSSPHGIDNDKKIDLLQFCDFTPLDYRPFYKDLFDLHSYDGNY